MSHAEETKADLLVRTAERSAAQRSMHLRPVRISTALADERLRLLQVTGSMELSNPDKAMFLGSAPTATRPAPRPSPPRTLAG